MTGIHQKKTNGRALHWPGKILFAILIASFLLANHAQWRVAAEDTKFVLGNDNGSHLLTGALLMSKPDYMANIQEDNRGFGLRPPIYSLFVSSFNEENRLPVEPESRHLMTGYQTLFFTFAGLVFALSCSAFYRNVYVGILVLVLLLADICLGGLNTTLRSHSLCTSFFLLSLSALPLTGKKSFKLQILGFSLFSLMMVAIALTRIQYYYWLIPAMPVLFLTWQYPLKRKLLYSLILLTPLLLSLKGWSHFAKTQEIDTRHRKQFYVFVGKAIAPNFYIGEKNSIAENAIAEMWNRNIEAGRRGNAFPGSEFHYYFENYSKDPESVDFREGVVEFNDFLKPLIFKSVLYNWDQLLTKRALDFWGYIYNKKPLRLKSIPKIYNHYIKLDYSELPSRAARIVHLQGYITQVSKTFRYYYGVYIPFVLYFTLLPIFLFFRKHYPQYVNLIVACGLLAAIDLLTVGVAFHRPKNIYRAMAVMPMWFSSILMAMCLLSTLTKSACSLLFKRTPVKP
jgi:hypothetical protein